MATKVSAQQIYEALKNDFGIVNSKGEITFELNSFRITVEQNNVVGNILEEWLAKWMKDKDYAFILNKKQRSPDFWLNPDNLDRDWLELKSFTGSPNFDIGGFRGYINEILGKPQKLDAKYLLLKYKMNRGGILEIQNIWLRNVWEISSPSARWPIKVDYKNNDITTLRPAIWYSDNTDYSRFASLEHFLAALEQTIYKFPGTNNLAETWLDTVKDRYQQYSGRALNVPRWNDIKSEYGL